MEEKTVKNWAILELFGHAQIAGQISEQVFAGASFIRVDVPAAEQQQEFTRTFNPSAVYCINWCTEATARAYVEKLNAKPVNIYDIRQAANRLLKEEASVFELPEANQTFKQKIEAVHDLVCKSDPEVFQLWQSVKEQLEDEQQHKEQLEEEVDSLFGEVDEDLPIDPDVTI